MAKTYAVCQIDGLIKLVEQPPAEGHFALAVGDLAVVRQVVRETAEPTAAPRGTLAHQVPGIDPAAADRENLGTIARYIQTLSAHNTPGFRALGA
ncbi:hypothetical protein [Pseudomonas anguilliseptica]|uniref:Uncharacterized protein n=1 Tax=Pseudomonas anguilliseptica TaxID=53406 RepID=A0A1H5A0T8_PSEAG|nr:hypothetical protein [Pseudomonas anguilliseptica]SED35341.1 hypothetical protein SAMN05421553_2508 [Pseudomonas anguilliseptica]